MSDATTHGHSDGHDHAHGPVEAAPVTSGSAPPSPTPAGFSLIEASAAGRLVPALLVLATLWASVYWALH